MNESPYELSLLETLDHLLDRGVVISGEAIISIGNVDLLYLGLNVILSNVDALAGRGGTPPPETKELSAE